MQPDTHKKAAVVAMGMFDGVHIGHRRLMTCARTLAQELGASPVAFTFQNSPRALFGPAPDAIMLPGEKRETIEGLGLAVDMREFTLRFAKQKPYEFLGNLMDTYEVKGIITGFNFMFGDHRSGNADTLRQFGREKGIEVRIIEPVVYNGAAVSSTRVRQAITEGNIREANAMLGAPFFYEGVVAPRKHIGQKLGFPTANLLPTGKILPPFGVYAALAHVEGGCYAAATNIGVRPTVDESSEPVVTVEPYLLDYAGEPLYGKKLRLEIIDFVRHEVRFPTREALRAQIARDVDTTRMLLAKP